MQIEKKWQIKDINPELISELSGKLNISKITAAILANRGVTNVQEAEVFLNPSFFEISNPFTLPDMEKATDRIRLALDKNEKILIYGDRDIDGVTAVSLLYLSLKRLGANVFWFIPSIEGYGLHKEIIERYLAEGVTLIITVDCGISNRDEISYAASKGVDVIVTDHHEPPDVPPDAHSLVDPKRKDSPVDFPDFAGCTVALKLAQALLMSYDELYDKELFVIDVETTGLHPYKDEICEIAAVRLFKFRKTDNFQTLVKTQGDISPEVTAIHGISNEMCKEAPEPKDAIAKFLNFIGDGVIVAHNAAFDLSFIKNYARKYLGKTLTNRVIDTLTISREFF
ncbi:MAG: exonuclease domain-containing protein, partial [Elusimicrobiota bacterium]